MDKTSAKFREIGKELEFSGPYYGRYRPVMGGVAIGHINSKSSATMGCLVRKHDKNYILSTASFLPENARQGDIIIQPSIAYGGTDIDAIARLSEFSFPINADASKNFDASLSEVLNAEVASSKIIGVGIPKGVRDPEVGLNVYQVGGTSGLTKGKIDTTDFYLKRLYYRGKEVAFDKLFVVKGILSRPGDAGAMLLDESGYLVGMLFAHSASGQSLYFPIRRILKHFDVIIVN